jgi:hypothetical protein
VTAGKKRPTKALKSTQNVLRSYICTKI